MPFIFPLLIDKQFDQAYIYIPFLLLGMVFNIIVSFIGSIYVALKKTKEVATTSLWASILNIIINISLIKIIGIYAAAISTILAFLIMSIYRYFDVQKYISLKINYKKNIKLIILLFISTILYYINNALINLSTFVIMIIYLTYINKEIIYKTIKKISKIKH